MAITRPAGQFDYTISPSNCPAETIFDPVEARLDGFLRSQSQYQVETTDLEHYFIYFLWQFFPDQGSWNHANSGYINGYVSTAYTSVGDIYIKVSIFPLAVGGLSNPRHEYLIFRLPYIVNSLSPFSDSFSTVVYGGYAWSNDVSWPQIKVPGVGAGDVYDLKGTGWGSIGFRSLYIINPTGSTGLSGSANIATGQSAFLWNLGTVTMPNRVGTPVGFTPSFWASYLVYDYGGAIGLKYTSNPSNTSGIVAHIDEAFYFAWGSLQFSSYWYYTTLVSGTRRYGVNKSGERRYISAFTRKQQNVTALSYNKENVSAYYYDYIQMEAMISLDMTGDGVKVSIVGTSTFVSPASYVANFAGSTANAVEGTIVYQPHETSGVWLPGTPFSLTLTIGHIIITVDLSCQTDGTMISSELSFKLVSGATYQNSPEIGTY